MMRRTINIVLLAIIVCCLVFLAYTGAAAAKKPLRTDAPALLAATPSAPAVGDTIAFSGCGYTPSSSVTIIVYSPGAAAFFGAATDDNGCFDTAATENYTADEAGAYEVDAYQAQLLVATIHFTAT